MVPILVTFQETVKSLVPIAIMPNKFIVLYLIFSIAKDPKSSSVMFTERSVSTKEKTFGLA